jgi:teichuronic acid biosynthesis glycosyltransferase TuaC
MRVLAVTNLYVTPEVPWLGTYVEQQITGLRQIGLDFDVLFLDRARNGVGVYLFLARQLRTRIAKFKPDLVHVMYGGVMAHVVTSAVTRIPTIVTFHGSDLLGEHLSGRIREAIAGFGVRCSKTAAQRASGVITVSQVLADALPQNVNRTKVRVIPCGIDLRRFKPLDQHTCRERLHWARDRFHVLFSGSSDPVKRPWLAQATIKKLHEVGIEAELHFLRGIPNDQVPLWLNASHVVLLTSLHEGSPTIVKEALACNVPVVSVDVGDVKERIAGIDGCYLASPDPDDLSLKLKLVLTNWRRVPGRTTMKELSLQSVALRIKTFYEDVVLSVSRSSGDSQIGEATRSEHQPRTWS